MYTRSINKKMSQSIDSYTKFDFGLPIDFDTNQTNTFGIVRPVLSVLDSNNIHCNIVEDNFTFCLHKNRFRDNVDICFIICSKDNGKILDYTLNILQTYNIDKKYDILLVDDRSQTSDILNLSDKYNTSYLKISNNNDIFNYSVINNIAATYANHFGKQLVIFYNNDLWPSSDETIDNLIRKHIENKSDISGCKLLYPSKEMYDEIGKPTHILEPYLDQIHNTIQHGGIHFILKPALFLDSSRKYYGPNIVLAPSHSWRFFDPDTPMASFDTKCFAVTGAIQIVNINKFIELNGFNNGLCTAFQDIDLCIKAIENNNSVYYFGSEYMYHAESLTQAIEQNNYNKNIDSDNIMWELLWHTKLPNRLGLQK